MLVNDESEEEKKIAKTKNTVSHPANRLLFHLLITPFVPCIIVTIVIFNSACKNDLKLENNMEMGARNLAA